MIRRLGPWPWTPGERLGGGGYAAVYGAPGEGHAVKVYHDPHHANTFQREVAALGALQGAPGVAELLDYGRDAAGRLCIVTERLAGERLDRRLRRAGTLDGDGVARLLEGLLPLLAEVHRRGWLHKDVKASNVLVDGERFTLLDWGVAEPLGDGHAEPIRAKQEFVAPECFYGEHDPSGDLYALAWLAVQAASGALPYHFAEVHDADYRVAAHCMERVELPPAVPAALRPLLLGWLAKSPAERPVGYELTALLAHPSAEPDPFEHLDFRQLAFECGWLHRAARYGVPYAQYHYGRRLLDAGREREALYWLEGARESGYRMAGYRLARHWEAGEEPARQRARALLRELAEAGHGAARYRLGRALLEEAPVEAERWLRLAAEAGERRAQYRLARLLEGRPAEAEEAARFRAMAADRGDPRLPSVVRKEG
ncbi:Sel1-like repeat-containing protein kinase family protein [Endothiovibrio diazotrophicus]